MFTPMLFCKTAAAEVVSLRIREFVFVVSDFYLWRTTMASSELLFPSQQMALQTAFGCVYGDALRIQCCVYAFLVLAMKEAQGRLKPTCTDALNVLCTLSYSVFGCSATAERRSGPGAPAERGESGERARRGVRRGERGRRRREEREGGE